MLVLKHKHHLDFPHLTFEMPRAMTLSPVLADGDDLVAEIENDTSAHDDNWQLSERPDQKDLEKYWSNVEADVEADPDWINFNED